MYFFFNDTATTEIYTLSLHDALPIFVEDAVEGDGEVRQQQEPLHRRLVDTRHVLHATGRGRSEEHTSELQSQFHLVCRLLLEKKNDDCVISMTDLFDFAASLPVAPAE